MQGRLLQSTHSVPEVSTAMTALNILVILLVVPWMTLAQDIISYNITPKPESAGGAYGWMASEYEHKWAVGVHKRYSGEQFDHICGGTLVTAQLVLSAAHCFWNDGRAVELNDYRMTLGNLLREYNFSPNDTKELIRDLFFHERYRGSELNFAHDIVIVRLMRKVKFSSTVEPVAIDWRSSFKDEDLMGQSGTVVGWGYTEFDQPSFTRIAVNLPYVDFDTCWKTVPRSFRRYITPDKFCAGLRNVSAPMLSKMQGHTFEDKKNLNVIFGTSVCPGDSGGGLVFANIFDKKWYIRGIVSVGVQPDNKSKCRKAQFSAFTSISSYRTWLRDKFVLTGESLSNPLTQTEKTVDPDVIVFPSD